MSAAKTSGFTLVELMTVVAVIMILVSITVGIQRGVHSKQANTRARSELNAIGSAVEMYKATYGTYPRLGTVSTGNSDENRRARAQLLFNHLVGDKYWKWDAASQQWQEINGGRMFLDPSTMDVEGQYGATGGNAPYFVDPWGKPYDYIHYEELSGGAGQPTSSFFVLYSTGNDRKGGSNAVADFVSAQAYFRGDDASDRADDIVYELENN